MSAARDGRLRRLPDTGRARRRHLGLAALTVVLSATAFGPAIAPAARQSANALRVEAPLTSEFGFGDSVVIDAVIEADSLIDGSVTASAEASTTTVVRELQVAGGAVARVLLVVPVPSFNGGGPTNVDVELLDGDEVIARARLSFSHHPDVDVTGVLPRLRASLAQMPNRVQLEPDVRGSQFATLTSEIIGLGPGALSQLDSIAGTSADLANLEPEARRALVAWVDDGGRLLIDDDTDLAALPAEWRPGPAGYALAGLGEVRLTNGRAAAGKWKEILTPAELDGLDAPFGFGTETFADPQSSMARRAGVVPPSLSPILLALGIYVVVVGPVMYLVLRAMRRLTLAWIVIPALAAAVATGVVITGGTWRRGGEPVANIAVQSHPEGSTSRVETLLFNRRGGESEIVLPARWTSAEATVFFGEDPSTAAERRFRVGDRSSSLSTSLEPGQVAVLRAAGESASGTLAVSALATGRRAVAGTVTNTGDRPLQAVAVFAAGDVRLVGDLAAGETKQFVLDNIDAAMIGQVSLGDQVWQDPAIGFGFAPVVLLEPAGTGRAPGDFPVGAEGDAASVRPEVDLGLWGSFSSLVGQGLYAPGIVRAVGWRFEQPSEVTAGGQVMATEMSSAVGAIGVGEALERVAVRSLLITSPFDGVGNGQQVNLLRLPPEAVGRPLQVVMPAGAAGELWTGTAWTKLDPDRPELPAGVVATGTVLLRTSAVFNGGPFNTGSVTVEEVR